MADSFPRERVLEELRALREATQALHRRLDSLIGEVDGEAAADPRIVEIARRAIAELRAKSRPKSLAKPQPLAKAMGERPSKAAPRRQS